MRKNKIEISSGVKQKKIPLGNILGALIFLLIAPSFALAETWNYTALGDSLAYGYGATENYGYVERYRDYIEADNGVTVELTNLGVLGCTSSNLLYVLRTDSAYRSAVANSDVITLDIGGNDFVRMLNDYISGNCGGKKNNKCLTKTRKRFKSNFKKIVKLTKKISKKKKPVIRSMDIYFPDTTFYLNDDYVTTDKYPNDFAAVNFHLKKFNKLIRQICRKNKVLYADVHHLYNGSSGMEDPSLKGYIFYDDVHPNDAGYQVIADGLQTLGYSATR